MTMLRAREQKTKLKERPLYIASLPSDLHLHYVLRYVSVSENTIFHFLITSKYAIAGSEFHPPINLSQWKIFPVFLGIIVILNVVSHTVQFTKDKILIRVNTRTKKRRSVVDLIPKDVCYVLFTEEELKLANVGNYHRPQFILPNYDGGSEFRFLRLHNDNSPVTHPPSF